MDIDLSQRYGNINLPAKNDGESRVTVKYGNINAGSFTKTLRLDAKYSNVNVRDVVNAFIELGYCGEAGFGNGKQLTVESKYSTLRVGHVDVLKLEKKYGNLKARELGKAFLELKYSDATIDRLVEEMSIGSLDYSTLRVYDRS